ncbi:MAG: class A beta-lactamase, subclass A2 [Flavobacteriaceae bacterium]
MTKSGTLVVLMFLLCFNAINAQSIESLKERITEVLKDKSATVGVSIQGANPADTISINGNKRLPMQSVFKYHLAVAILNQVDQGNLDLSQKVLVEKDLVIAYNHLWSPLREKYPNGGEISLAELIEYTVAWSDNLGCDVLFDLVGGPKVVQSYLHKIGIEHIAIVYKEIMMQAEWDRQYENWTTTNAANQMLQLFFENTNNLLSDESYHFLLKVMKDTKTGKKSIRGFLPEDVIVAHKTGSSGKNSKGLTGALNDIGIVFLPNNSYFYLSVLLSDSMEDKKANQKIIADIAKLAWDYFRE